ncbi:unnamed protein product [Adineta ricciae]|uniref:G-protein coupled receptors family 1 profile domain-containing protein n=1 Tax=Adineta ricciae TaxID=249248 RepID=A0A815I2T3_ADIRI|nr:unnamed protein product [Adineta ricciae]CAF1362465.1 unnamed protein product [Adineta ricciae]
MITDYLFALIYYKYKRILREAPSFCLWWNWWIFSATTVYEWSAAWGSIERHLLIFHENLISTREKEFSYHTLPILTVIVYSILFYFIVIVCSSCGNYLDHHDIFCPTPCFLQNGSIMGLYDITMHAFIPVTVVIVTNAALVVRILLKDQRQCNLATYTVAIAILFMVTVYPVVISRIISMHTRQLKPNILQIAMLTYLPTLSIIGLPVVSLLFLPDFKATVLSFPEGNINSSHINT